MIAHFFLTIRSAIYPFKPIEILLTLFVLFAWSRVILRWRDHQINQKELAFWSILWLVILVMVYVPGKTTYLAHLLGMGRGFDAMVFIAIIALFYTLYRLYIKANETEQEITEIVRQMALRLDVKKGRTRGRKAKR